MHDISSPSSTTSLSALFVRLYWLIFGNILLAFMGMMILLHSGGGFFWADIAYGAGLALLVGARWLDVTRLDGLTTEGEPATPAHLRRYVVLTLAVGVPVWGALHGLAALTS
ncbi:MAG: hypothetical protein EP329_06895 [Deltaproteobacteria bacterium]|nr:MAG: hypothetical protein EP329_06895 [Deltaproteobacteria bacterium]